MKQLLFKIVCASMIVTFCVGYTYLYIKDNEVSKVRQEHPVNKDLTAKK